MALGKRLRGLRTKRKLTGRAAAKYLGISGAHVSDMESGKSSPSLDMLIKLVEYYETSSDYLLGIVDDPAPAADLVRQPAEITAAVDLLAAAGPARRSEMLAVLTVMAIAAKQAEERVNPLVAKLDETTRRQLERSIQVEGDLSVADIRGILEALQEQEKK